MEIEHKTSKKEMDRMRTMNDMYRYDGVDGDERIPKRYRGRWNSVRVNRHQSYSDATSRVIGVSTLSPSSLHPLSLLDHLHDITLHVQSALQLLEYKLPYMYAVEHYLC